MMSIPPSPGGPLTHRLFQRFSVANPVGGVCTWQSVSGALRSCPKTGFQLESAEILESTINFLAGMVR